MARSAPLATRVADVNLIVSGTENVWSTATFSMRLRVVADQRSSAWTVLMWSASAGDLSGR